MGTSNMAHRRPLDKAPDTDKADIAAAGEVLAVRVSPRARADRLLGFRQQDGGAGRRSPGEVLHAQVTAAPEGGRANRALAALVARTAGVPRRAVVLVAGGRGRYKLLRVPTGIAALLRRRFEEE